MATPNKNPLDKEKLLDQKLEDFAGEEFDEDEYAYSGRNNHYNSHDITEELDSIDLYH